MKVLYVERSLPGDGIVFDQIKRMGKLGLDTRVLSVNVGHGPLFQNEAVQHVHIPFFPKVEFVKSMLFKMAATRGQCRLYEGGFRADIAHAHFAYPEGYAVFRIASKLGIPYVVTLRGDDILLYPGRGRYLAQCIRDVLRNTGAVICVSEKLCGVAAGYGIEKARLHHISDGIRSDVFTFSEQQREPGAIVFAGTLLPVKNIVTMIRSFAILNASRPDIKVKIAGEGPLLPEARNLAASLGIGDKVCFLGQLAPEALAKIMQTSSVLCLPSVSEGWGNVVTEAMACGTPVVASRVGGLPEQVPSDDYGYLCDPHEPNDIAEKLMMALSRDWDRKKIAGWGARFTREGAAAKVHAVYEEVLRRR